MCMQEGLRLAKVMRQELVAWNIDLRDRSYKTKHQKRHEYDDNVKQMKNWERPEVLSRHKLGDTGGTASTNKKRRKKNTHTHIVASRSLFLYGETQV